MGQRSVVASAGGSAQAPFLAAIASRSDSTCHTTKAGVERALRDEVREHEQGVDRQGDDEAP
jgi:hypothetical protein